MAAGDAAEQTRVLDDFASVGAWTAAPSEGVSTALAADGGALRLDVDFHGGGGWALIRRPLPLTLPANYTFSFRIRGELPANTLEFKLVDPTGDNVWWSTRRDFAFAAEWQTVTVRKRQIAFAWGPVGGGELTHVAALEIAITAGGGGKGSVWLDDLTLTELPPVHPYQGSPVATASGSSPDHPPAAAIDTDPATSWHAPGTGPAWLAIDFSEPREYGGLVLTWSRGGACFDYDVQTSDDGSRWSTVRHVAGSDGGADFVALPDGESRWLRIALAAGGAAPGLAEIEVMPLAFGASANALYAEMARRAPRGRFPRAFLGEQVYWTVVGADGSPYEALLSEDGAIEVDKGQLSIEPFVLLDGRLVAWADVTETQSLADDYLPIPTVTWTHPRFTLDVTALAAGDAVSSSLLARYAVHNPGRDPLRATVFLALRPLQVNPPAQVLNTPGGAAPVAEIARDGDDVVVNGARRIAVWPAPAGFGAATFDAGDIGERLAAGMLPAAAAVRDPDGHASAALAFSIDVPPGGRWVVVLEAPFPGSHRVRHEQGLDAAATFDEALEATRLAWRERLNRVTVSLPPAGKAIGDTLRSTLAYILVNRDGAAIQPGSRAYDRSWIRDGSLTSTALLRLGHADEVRDFIDWFARYQFPSGKVPCCVDARGSALTPNGGKAGVRSAVADPVPENDSPGELLYLIGEYYAFTGDRALVEAHWDNVRSAVGYIDALRQQRRTDAWRAPEKLAYFGLLPESISHEGYSAKPMHSYWDDFWALRGLEDATDMAAALGKSDDAVRFAGSRDELRADLHASLGRAIAAHRIDYIPGCVELGDFDPTSTTIAVEPGGEEQALPRAELLHTFERYWNESVARRDGQRQWDAYTPYELRTVGVMVRLGWRERAMAMLDFFMRDRRPAAWNQWAEVVDRDPRHARFIGDMPHTWVGSDFIRSFLDMLAYERDHDDALVIAAGVPRAWIDDPEGVVVSGLRTRWGALSYRARSEDGAIVVDVADGLSVPAGGLLLDLPLSRPPRRVTVDGHRVAARTAPIAIRSLPAHVEVRP